MAPIRADHAKAVDGQDGVAASEYRIVQQNLSRFGIESLHRAFARRARRA